MEKFAEFQPAKLTATPPDLLPCCQLAELYVTRATRPAGGLEPLPLLYLIPAICRVFACTTIS